MHIPIYIDSRDVQHLNRIGSTLKYPVAHLDEYELKSNTDEYRRHQHVIIPTHIQNHVVLRHLHHFRTPALFIFKSNNKKTCELLDMYEKEFPDQIFSIRVGIAQYKHIIFKIQEREFPNAKEYYEPIRVTDVDSDLRFVKRPELPDHMQEMMEDLLHVTQKYGKLESVDSTSILQFISGITLCQDSIMRTHLRLESERNHETITND